MAGWRERSSWRRAGALAAFALVGFVRSSTAAPLTLASGASGGVYLPVSRNIAKAAALRGLDIQVRPSSGSKENLLRLGAGGADLGVAQSDLAYDAFHGLPPFPHRISTIRALSSLYTEPVQIVVRTPLYIHHLTDLRGKRVALGPEGSGTESNAESLLEVAGLTLSEVSVRHLGFEAAFSALRRDEIDAVFVTSGVPSPAVEAVLRDRSAYLFELDHDLIERLIEACPFFLATDIPAGTYSHQTEEISTVGVAALLVGRSDLPEGTVTRLLGVLAADSKILAGTRFLRLGDPTKERSIPAFPAAREAFERYSFASRWKLPKVGAGLGAVLATVLLWAGVRRRRRVLRFIGRHGLARFVIFFLLLWLLGSLGLYLAEHRVNENYSTLWVSLWSGVVTIYSLSSKEPFTVSGRVIAFFMLLLGLGGITWLTGEIASLYVYKRIMGAQLKMRTLRDHYVIVNWNEKGRGIVEQLHSPDLGEPRPIAILGDGLSKPEIQEPGLVYVSSGSPFIEADLRNVNVAAARSVIVLADLRDEAAADAKTILTLVAVRKLCAESGEGRAVPLIAEILDPQKVELALYAGSHGGASVEIVSSHELGRKLLTHAAANPGLTNLYEQLLTFRKGGSEIHRAPIPSHFLGRSFDHVSRAAAEMRPRGVCVIPIGVLRQGKVFVNPLPSEVDALCDGDVLFSVCDNQGDFKRFAKLTREASA